MAFLSQFFGGIDTLSSFFESLKMMGLLYLNYHIHKTDDLKNKHFFQWILMRILERSFRPT